MRQYEMTGAPGLCHLDHDGPPTERRCMSSYLLGEIPWTIAPGRVMYPSEVGGLYRRCGGWTVHGSQFCYSHDPASRRRSSVRQRLRKAEASIRWWQFLHSTYAVPRDRLNDRIQRMSEGYFG